MTAISAFSIGLLGQPDEGKGFAQEAIFSFPLILFGRTTSNPIQQVVCRTRSNQEIQTESSESSVELPLDISDDDDDDDDEYMNEIEKADDADSCYFSACSDRSFRSNSAQANSADDEAGIEVTDANWTIESFCNSRGELAFKLRTENGAAMTLFVDEILFTLLAIAESSNNVVFKVVSMFGDVAFVSEKDAVAYISCLVDTFRNQAVFKGEALTRSKWSKRHSRKHGAEQGKTCLRKKPILSFRRRQSRRVQDETVDDVNPCISPQAQVVTTNVGRSRKMPLNCMLRFMSHGGIRSPLKAL